VYQTRTFLTFCLLIGAFSIASGQKNVFFKTEEKSQKKGFSLQNLYFNFSSGYGNQNWQHSLSNVGLRAGDDQNIYFSDATSSSATATNFTRNDSALVRTVTLTNTLGLQDWVQNPGSSIGGQPFRRSETITYEGRVISQTTTNLPTGTVTDGYNFKYTGTGHSIPFNLSVAYAFPRFRLGAGVSFEFTKMGLLKQKDSVGLLKEFEFGTSIFSTRRLYGYVGYTFFRSKSYVYTTDMNIGIFRMSKSFDRASMRYLPMFNGGVTLEKNLSEYFRVSVSPRFEFKSYNLALPGNIRTVKHDILALYALVGISYSIPSGKKCPIKACGIRMHHVHGGQVWRGNPFYRWQNPRYGEEDPKLVKYKYKNRRKINPY